MSEESAEDLDKRIALLEQQLAAITAERNLLHDQLGQAQEATLAAERRAAAAETELKIVREQNLVSDGKVVTTNDLPTPQQQPPPTQTLQPQALASTPPPQPPATPTSSTEAASEKDQSRLAKIWRWLWEENNRSDEGP